MVIVAGGMTGVATRPLNLSTKWNQVVSCTLQPLGKKLDRAQGRLDAVQLCPSPGNQPTALSILVQNTVALPMTVMSHFLGV